jgi:uncharacterized RDD family membrane protein YckC
MIGAVVGPLVTPVVDHVDVDHVVSKIDVDHIIDRVDVDAVLARVDINAVIDRVDVERLIDRVDIDQVLERVDLNALVGRIDINTLVERVDLNAVISRVDVNEVLARVDTDALVERTEIGALIARSTTGIFATVLDAVRRQIVTIDLVVQGLVDRVLRRKDRYYDDGTENGKRTFLPWRRDLALQGTPAGPVSRLIAFLLDVFLVGILFVLLQRMFALTLEVLVGRTWIASEHRPVAALAVLLWTFAYFSVPLAVVGRTPGKGLLGLKVIQAEGGPLSGRRAAWRTLVFPLSFILLIGFIIGFLRADHRALHDLIARTREVYAWDARGAHLRLLAMRHETT